MGRPPIGKKAMTATERSHRFRAKHAATKPATRQSGTDAAAQAAEIARLKAVGAEKDHELAALRLRADDAEAALKQAQAQAQARPAAAPNEPAGMRALWATNKRLTDELDAVKKQLAAARAANPGASAADEKAAYRLAREVDRLKAALAKAEALLAADPGEVGKLEKQLKGARTQIKNLRSKLYEVLETAKAKGVTITKADKRTMWRALHPDSELDPARKKVVEKAAQIFGGLGIYEIDGD